jgi:hypothetical protein
MAASQLSLYNGACRLLGEARLQSLAENREARYLLDDVWADGAGLIQAVLEQGFWYFAVRTSKLGYDTSLTPNFGYRSAFEKPSDWVRTVGVCQDEYFLVPLTQFTDEAGYLYTDLQTIYFRYVSNGPTYGGNLALWPQTFVLATEGYMAERIVRKLTAGDEKKVMAIQKEAKRLMNDARSKVAMNESAAFLPVGSWVRGRWGNRSTNDQGGQNSLIG